MAKRTRTRSQLTRKLAAVIMVGLLIGIVALAAGQFLGWFKDTATVTMYAPRAGLVMNPDAKVRLRGVEVGRVSKIENAGSDGAKLTLAMNSSQLHLVPGNVDAEIKSNTIFGAKAVDLLVPESGASGALAAGDVITANRVAVELNTLYQELVGVLAMVEPDKLNVITGAVSGMLTGRGEEIGDALEQLTTIVGETNEHLPELRRMLAQAGPAVDPYADSVDHLMRVVDNAVEVGNLLVDNTANLDKLLMNVTAMAGTANGVLAPSADTLNQVFADTTPVARLLGRQAPGLRCFIVGMSNAADVAEPLLGGKNGNLLLDAGLIPGQNPYRYPQDLPLVGADGPPTCEGGLSDIDSPEHVDFYVTDNAPQPYQPRTTPKVQAGNLFQLLFTGPPRG